MQTKLVAATLIAFFALSVSSATATTEIVLTSGGIFTHAGVAGLNLHGPEFDLQASIFGPGVGDFAPTDGLCFQPCPFGFLFFNAVQFSGTDPTFTFGTLTWQGVTYQLLRAVNFVIGFTRGLGLRLPSESGAWHVDFPDTMSFYLPAFDLRLVGVGIWALDISCDAAPSQACLVFGSLTIRVKRQVLACDGFASPADDVISLSRKANRVIPLQITLQDWWSHEPATNDGIAGSFPPAVQISFSSEVLGVAEIDVTDQFTPVGSQGNAFTYHAESNEWRLNLSTKPFKEPGTYHVRVTPGSSEYAIVRNDFTPTCDMQFVRQ